MKEDVQWKNMSPCTYARVVDLVMRVAPYLSSKPDDSLADD